MTFFFRADKASSEDVAEAVADHFGVSVLLGGAARGKSVSGRLLAADVDGALDALCFLLGVQWRGDQTGRVYLVGGEKVDSLVAVPSYGLRRADLGGAISEGGAIVGDRLVMEATAQRAAEVRDVLAVMGSRPALTLELFVLDVATNTVDRVNAWLDSLKGAVGYAARSAFTVGTGGAGAIGGAAAAVQKLTYSGPTYDVQVGAVMDLLERDKNSRIQLREQLSVLSGAETLFEAGEVFEDVIYVRDTSAPGGGSDLVTRIERRTVGLNVSLSAAVVAGDVWHVRVELADSARMAGRETTTRVQGEKLIREGDPYSLLGSFTRDTLDSARSTPFGAKAKGWLGRRLSKSETTTRHRSLMVLVRPVSVQRIPNVILQNATRSGATR